MCDYAAEAARGRSDQGFHRPCPAKVRGYLGFPDPDGQEIPCGLLEGHLGSHTYTISWVDE